MKVAYQGEPGAYSWVAARRLFGEAELVGRESFEAVFEELELGRVNTAVLPVENTVIGSIGEVWDLVWKAKDWLRVGGEVSLLIDHALLGLPGSRRELIERVYSHPGALDQCQNYLMKHWMKSVVHEDMAGAVRMVAEVGNVSWAAVASEAAGKLYGLEVLERRIQTNKEDYTRFLVFGKDGSFKGDTFKGFEGEIVNRSGL